MLDFPYRESRLMVSDTNRTPEMTENRTLNLAVAVILRNEESRRRCHSEERRISLSRSTHIIAPQIIGRFVTSLRLDGP